MSIGADRFVDDLEAHDQARHATQRYQRGFSDIDMWNFDTFLADIIVAGCNWMIDEAISIPTFVGDLEDWHLILAEIRDGFATRKDDAPAPPDSAWELLRRYFNYMWD